MTRGLLFQHDYRPQLSGHETFPLRYGWLKKVFDAIEATENQDENKSVFLGDDAIARFGVGKNMVASMRHWSNVTSIIEEEPASKLIRTTELGRRIFGKRGLDPYMEHPATLWLFHWQLAAHPEKTTWFWAFNHFPAITFERDQLVKGITRLANECAWSRVAATTIKSDVACFVRTYVAHRPPAQTGNDDALESPLTELGLIKPVGKRDGYRFVRGPKSSLGDGVFVYALLDFWSRYSSAATLSFEAIAHAPGAPGRVFLLEENDVVDRLTALEEVTGGILRWSETAGLKQVVRDANLNFENILSFIDRDFSPSLQKEVA